MMKIDEILGNIKEVKKRVLDQPLESTSASQTILNQAQKDLEGLLSSIESLPKAQQRTAIPVVQDFSKDLQVRLNALQEKVNKIQEGMKNNTSHEKMAKAYSGKIF